MKSHLLSLFLLIIATVSIAQPFVLEGHIHDMTSGKIRLSYFDPVLKSYRNDTANVHEGKFHFTGVIQNSCRAILQHISSQDVPRLVLYFQAGQNKLEGNAEDLEHAKVTAGADQLVYEKYNGLWEPLYKKLSIVRDSLKGAEKRLEQSKQQTVLQEQLAYWQQQEQQIEEEIANLKKRFVLANAESTVSGDILTGLLDWEPDSVVNALFFSLQTAVQNHPELQQLHARANMRPGAVAPAFMAENIKGEPILISFDKQQPLTLLDFWASWCGPCREDVPQLKKLQTQYGSNRLAVLPVSIFERKKEKWLEAIDEDGTTHWPHVYSQQFTSNCASMMYGVQAIPVKIIIDTQGKIVYRSEPGSGIMEISTFLKNYYGY